MCGVTKKQLIALCVWYKFKLCLHSSFDHPNIMKIIGICDLHDGNIGIAMDVLRGGDLLSFLRENRQDDQVRQFIRSDILNTPILTPTPLPYN